MIAQFLRDHRDTILSRWEEKISVPEDKKLRGASGKNLFDFFVTINLGNGAKLEKEIDEFIAHDGIRDSHGVDVLLNNLVFMKRTICDTALQELDTGDQALRALVLFSEKFERALLVALKRYHNAQMEIISSQKKLFEKANDLLRSAVNFSNIGLFILDRNLRIIYWGSGLERMYRIRENEVLNKPISEQFPALKDEGVFEKFERTLRTGESFEMSAVAHQSLRRGKRIIDFKISPLREENGDIIGVNVLLNDVTERQRSEASLKEYQQFLSNIFDDAAEAIFVLDENDCVKLWNKQAEKMYGYSAEEMIGKHISLIVPNDEKSRREIELINKIVKEKGFVKDWETERITHDGRKLLLRITRTAIRDENDNYRGSSVIAHDISEQRRLEQQLIHSEKLSAVGQLAAGIAHEVGSPLTAISSLAQLLYERDDDEWNKDKLKIIREQIDRIARIVRELVNFSKPISTDVKDISVNQVIEEAIQIVRYDRRLKHLTINLDLFPGLPMIRASFDQLLQVLINILLNAGDALEGRPDGEISISTQLVGEKIIIRIIDNGAGIAGKYLDHIFEPFFTTKGPGKGTGLGLWVCYNIVKGFSGEIVAESEENQGTAFHIILPVLKDLDEIKDE
ncbi:MAG: PAS domain S-box protein [Calditrichaeota bacterium]|nr:PAS domain S-box protein [Calditrichota bacterium]